MILSIEYSGLHPNDSNFSGYPLIFVEHPRKDCPTKSTSLSVIES